MGATSNFSFLAAQDEQLARLGALAERYFFDDAPSALIKLRQLVEFIAKDVAARQGLLPAQNVTRRRAAHPQCDRRGPRQARQKQQRPSLQSAPEYFLNQGFSSRAPSFSYLSDFYPL
jgi:hypothetical protein